MEAVKYCLPKLLMIPMYHCLHYFDLIKVGKALHLSILHFLALLFHSVIFKNYTLYVIFSLVS